MRIGHINLEASMNGTGEHFVRLVEALEQQGVEQHVLVANHALAKRVNLYDTVTVGPVVKTPVMAYCLMPDAGVIHAHGRSGGQAGLLMTLTRATPYVLTRRSLTVVSKNPVSRSIISRAATVICPDEAAAACVANVDSAIPVEIVPDIAHDSVEAADADAKIASHHLRIYRRAMDNWRVSAVML